MNIKTIRVKANVDNQDFTLTDFYAHDSKIYSTNTKLIKEHNEYFWLVMIAYESSKTMPIGVNDSSTDYQLPNSFVNSVTQYIVNKTSNGVRVKYSLYSNIDSLLTINSMNDFLKIPGLGVKTIEQNVEFLSGLIDLINKYKVKG